MAVTSSDERLSIYNPVTPTTEFPAGFPIFDIDDLSVYVDGLERTDFSVSATFNEGVSTDAKILFSPGVTGTVVVAGDRDPRRQSRFANGAPLPIWAQNLALDTLTAQTQEARRDVSRAVKVSFGAAEQQIPDPDGSSYLGWSPDNRLVNRPSEETSSGSAEAAAAAAKGFRDEAEEFANSIDPDNFFTKSQSDARFAPLVHTHAAADITDFDAAVRQIAPMPPSFITGGEIDRLNANVLQVHPCQMANGGGDPTEFLRTTVNKTLNPTTVGVGGMDVGPTPANDTMLYIYMIKHLTTGQTEFILSREVSFGAVTYPSGYGAAKVQKHPLAFPYKSIGFPPFYHTRNFSALYFTDSDDGGYYDLVANTNTGGLWATVSAALWMPDSARACIFMSRTDYNSGAGDARVRPGSGTAAAGFVVGKVNASGQSDWTGQHCIRTNSARELARNVGSGVRNWLQIVGYCPLEI